MSMERRQSPEQLRKFAHLSPGCLRAGAFLLHCIRAKIENAGLRKQMEQSRV